jgi:hypothetical protein
MNIAQVVALGIRLFCIWLAMYLLARVPDALLLRYARDGWNSVAVGNLVIFIILIGATIALWWFPLAVARKLLPKATLDQPTSLPIDQVQSAGFCLLGLWLLTEAIPPAFYVAVLIYYATRPNAMIVLEPHNYAAIVRMLVEFGLGFWLLFGARGLLGIVQWARSAGAGEPSNSAPHGDGREASHVDQSPSAPARGLIR